MNGQLAIKTEGMEDTFKDIAVYSTLAMILFRKEQERTMEERFNLEPVDNLDARLNKMKESAEKIIAERAKDKEYENMHPMQAMRQIAEEQQEEEEKELCKICPNCGQENKNGVERGTARENECSECGYKYFHAEASAHEEFFRRARDN